MRRITRRLGSLIMAVVLLVSAFPITVRAASEDWVEISSVAGLINISSNLSGNYRLTADIDLGGAEWNPIGPFTGKLDGNSKVIRNFTINDTSTPNRGLFSSIEVQGESRGLISDLGIENAQITGGSNVGVLAGTNGGTISRCYTKGSVNGYEYVGGLVGQNSGIIEDSFTQASVSGKDYLGGLAGANSGTVQKSYAASDLTASVFNNYLEFNGTPVGDYSAPNLGGYIAIDHKDDYVGEQFTLEAWFQWDDTNTNDVNFIMGKGYEQFEIHTGGGAGVNGIRFIPIWNESGDSHIDVKNVIRPGWFHVAAVYEYDSILKQAKARVYINGEAQDLWRGTVNLGKEVTLSRSFNTLGYKKVDGVYVQDQSPINIGRRTDGWYYFDGRICDVRFWNIARTGEDIKRDKDRVLTGSETGLVGYWRLNEESGDAVDSATHNNGTLTGDVVRTSETAATHKGGLIGQNTGAVSNSYYDSEASGQTDAAGTPESTENMKLQSTFTDWDFTDTWRLDSEINGGYPYLIPIIRSATVSITAPAAGGYPLIAAQVDALTGNAYYTVSNVTWNEGLTTLGRFMADQIYTANITLTSKNGMEFGMEAFTPSVAGSASVGTTAVLGNGVGNSVTFTVTFPKTAVKTVTSIWVKTQPGKLVYAEGTDNILDLSGMELTEHYNDLSTAVISFANGAAEGYTTSPANGAVLTAAANNTKINVIHTASGATAQTTNLIVGTAADNDIDLAQWTGGDTIIIPAGSSVTITGTRSNTRIICGAGVSLTLDDVTITNTINGYSPVTFTGQDNNLIISGINSVTGGNGAAGVTTTGAELNINGDGKLAATGGGTGYTTPGGAGIGGNENADGGKITISGGTIIAQSAKASRYYKFRSGEGIAAANVEIAGGKVTAKGSFLGAGISGSRCAPDSSVTILGGDVTATGNSGTPGIGGYINSIICKVTVRISGGRVVAIGAGNSVGNAGAGIGSSDMVLDNGSIVISGGEVFAASGTNLEGSIVNDIGRSSVQEEEWDLEISGTAKVFLQNSRSEEPVTVYHTLEKFTVAEAVYGISLPDGWTAPFSAYLPLTMLSYDLNGGSGSAPAAVTQLADTTAKAAGGDGFSMAGHSFCGWNTAADGSGTAYQPEDQIALGNDDVILYAQWTEVLSAAGVSGITAPTAGAEPQTAADLIAGHTGYTVTGLTWTDSDGVTPATLVNGRFKMETVYKAVIELTAKASYKFQAVTPAVNAGTADAGTINTDTAGNKLTFTVSFPATAAKTVNGIQIDSQPAGLIYAEGESLDLTGLQVTLTYIDGSAAAVAAADFGANGITASPANGTVLAAATHNGKPVTLSCGGYNTKTGSLIVLKAPTIKSAAAGDSQVKITWDSVSGAAGYKIFSSTTPGSYGAALKTVSGSVYSCDATGLDNGTTYYFVVRAINGGTESAGSNEVSATPQAYVPGAPVLESAVAGDRYVSISWRGVTGSKGYKIFSRTASGFYNEPEATVAASVYSCDVTGLTNGTVYYFAVKAISTGGDSAYSNEVNAMPRTVPGAPTNVMAAAGNGQAVVSFTAPTDNGGSPITGYLVTSSPGDIEASGTGTAVTVTGLTNGTTYTFTIKAVNEAGTGPESAASNAVTPHRPSNGDTDKDSDKEDTPSRPVIPSPPANGIEIFVNGKAETAATSTTVQNGTNMVTTIVIDDNKIEQRLAQEGDNAVVAIADNSGASIVVGQLNGQTVKNMEAKAAVLEIKTGQATYTLPAAQINIDAISEAIGKDVELKDITVNIKISQPTADTVRVMEDTANKNNYQLVVSPVEFEITCSNGSKTLEVSRFNSYVERLVAIPEGVDPSRITTGIILNSDGTFSHVPTVITVIDGKYYAKINSLTNSVYSVIYSPKTFKDIENHWAKKAVNDMASRLVIGGGTDGLFSPDKDITRAEFASILVRALGLMRPGTGKDVFNDVGSKDWYYDSISIAHQYGIISGYGNGQFRPQDTVTREQAMTMIARAMSITGLKTAQPAGETEKLLSGFADGAEAAAYARDSIAACINTGIISGRNDSLIAPKDMITRAETAAIIQRLLQKSELIE